MVVVGIMLIAIGCVWFISRLMNQAIMVSMLRQKEITLGRYFFTELFTGFGLGVLLMVAGYMIAF